MDAFTWAPGDPHTVYETRVRPTWTLKVAADGTVTPELPEKLEVRDGPLLRPVAPFLELWALVGDGAPADWQPVPVTPALLAANGAGEADVTFTVAAVNAKAARRTGNPALRFGTFPPVALRADQHQAVDLRGESPPGATPPMIPAGRFIRLGSVQVPRPSTRPADAPWPEDVRVDVLRLRFTPGPGRVYGPPASAQPAGNPPVVPVPADRAFLDPAAGWFDAPRGTRVTPADTVDERGATRRSLGVVDDTCDAVVTVALPLSGDVLRARANVTVGPPHFGPDRRPFVSLADELNDRERDPAAGPALTGQQRAEWVEDLFERIAEVVSLFDVDYWRGQMIRSTDDGQPFPLPAAELAPTAIPGDEVPLADSAMGGRDLLRDRDIAVPADSEIEPLPLAARARERHRTLSDIGQLAPWVLAHPQRLRELIRPPFSVHGPSYAASWTMQMPPFMAQSNRWPLTLTHWQYDLLMAWADDLVAAGEVTLREGDVAVAPGDLAVAPGDGAAEPVPAAERAAPLSPHAEERRRQVLAVLDQDAGR
jgi:hypothetical protein